MPGGGKGATQRLAAIVDLGSASASAMVVRAGAHRRIDVVARAKAPLRLAAALDADERLGEDAWARTLEAFDGFAALLLQHGVEPGGPAVRAVATEALRRAKNGQALLAAVEARTGVRVKIIEGPTEARLVFAGLRLQWPRGALMGVDIGGASTELAYGTGVAPSRIVSLPVGALAAARRFGLGDAEISAATLAAARAAVDAAIGADVRAFAEGLDLGSLAAAGRVVGTSGSVQRVAVAVAAARAGHGTQGGGIDQAPLWLADVTALIERMAGRDRGGRMALPGMDPLRVDSLLPGALLLERVSLGLGVDCWRIGLSGLRMGLCAVALGRAAVVGLEREDPAG